MSAMTVMSASQPSRQRPSRQRGAAVVEFALVLIPLLVLAFGIVELGRTIYHYDTVVKSVRAASRLLAVYDPSDNNSFASAAAQARCLAAFGKTSCQAGDTPLAPGLSTAHVKICTRVSVTECPDLQSADVKNVSTGASTGVVQLVVVRIDGYQFSFLGLPLTGIGASVHFNTISSTMRGV